MKAVKVIIVLQKSKKSMSVTARYRYCFIQSSRFYVFLGMWDQDQLKNEYCIGFGEENRFFMLISCFKLSSMLWL